MFSSFKLMTPIVWLTRLLVGAYPHWQGCAPSPRQRIYFANHTSHLDTIVIWASLPPELPIDDPIVKKVESFGTRVERLEDRAKDAVKGTVRKQTHENP